MIRKIHQERSKNLLKEYSYTTTHELTYEHPALLGIRLDTLIEIHVDTEETIRRDVWVIDRDWSWGKTEEPILLTTWKGPSRERHDVGSLKETCHVASQFSERNNQREESTSLQEEISCRTHGHKEFKIESNPQSSPSHLNQGQ